MVTKSEVLELLREKYPGMEHYFVNHFRELGCGSYYCAGFVDSLAGPRLAGCWKNKYLRGLHREIRLADVDTVGGWGEHRISYD